MREWSTPARYEVPAGANATDDVILNARLRPEHPVFAREVEGTWRPVTSREFADEVRSLAAGLIGSGVAPGDRIGLMAGTSYEWVLCDLAILTAGAVTVPIYDTSPASQAGWVLRDSGATAVFAGDERLRSVLEQADVPEVRERWLMDGASLTALADRGSGISAEEVEQRRRDVGSESLASIVYTSGTTGRPKGCVISHGNMLAEIHSIVLADGMSESVVTDRDSILLFLPLAHILARVVGYAAFHQGTQVAHLSDLSRVPAELAAFRPTIVLAVPRVFERLYNTAQRRASGRVRAQLFRAATRTAIAYSRALDSGRPSRRLRAARRAFDGLVYGKLRQAMGGQVGHAVSGGAPLDAELGHFLRGAGVSILEGYGLTETTAAVTFNLPAAQRIGSVGRPLPGCAVRIAGDGEVLVKGGNITAGYWHNEQDTAAAFDEDGWFYTGDLGELDHGFLTVTGRKKDIIVTATGKNVAPESYEDRLRAHPLLGHCVLVGDRRPYLAALVTLDAEGFEQWKQDHGKPQPATVENLRSDPELIAAVQAAVDEVNASVSTAESIRRWSIVPNEFSIGRELTPTQKVRRDHVLAAHADEVEQLYPNGASARW
ncbi:MAG: AMP-dependent synthetase/ligase [Actinomycetota bacterium]